MKRIFSILALSVITFCASATTYYIDYENGNDSANGTSKSTPWKMHPYHGARGGANYSHSAGDRFIFKGGVTWPMQNCSTIQPAAGGTYGNSDYYGVDQTWYKGSSWTQPKFDAQGAEFNGGWCVFMQIPAVSPQHNITFDNLDFTGLYWSSTIRAQGGVAYMTIGTSTNITISNMKFRNWSHAAYSGQNYEDQLFCILGYNQSPYTAGCVITNCLFDGESAANKGVDTSSCQAAVFGWGGKILNCTVRNSAGGIFTSGAPTGYLTEVAGCTIGPLYRSYDPTMHHDGIQDNGGKGLILHDNYFTDIYSVPCFLGAGWGGGTYYIWNNVFDLRAQIQQQPIVFDAQAGANSFYIYNNTFVAGPGLNISRANWRPGGGNQITLLDWRNNHFVTDAGLITIDSGVTVSSTVNQNNLTQTYAQAGSYGYSSANRWQPTSASSPTVGIGQDLSSWRSGVLLLDLIGVVRPQSTTWDSGAYEYASGGGGGGVPSTPTNVSPADSATGVPIGPTFTTSSYIGSGSQTGFRVKVYASNGSTLVHDSGVQSAGTSYTLNPGNLQYSTVYKWAATHLNAFGESAASVLTSFTTTNATPADPPPLLTWPLQAEQMLLTEGWTTNTTSIWCPTEPASPDVAPLASCYFQITNSGAYWLKATVNCASGSANSFWIDIDGDPLTDTKAWDVIPLTSGLETRYVGWRGSGTFDVPQYATNTWNLAAGSHVLYIRGREANAIIDSLTFERQAKRVGTIRTLRVNSMKTE